MLAKLITLDLRIYRKQLKWILPIYGLTLLSAWLFIWLKIPYIDRILLGLATAATTVLIPGVLLLSLIHYYRHLYTDQGYLTQTLPVTPNQRYHAKLISAFLLYILATILSLAGFSLLVQISGAGQEFGINGFEYIRLILKGLPETLSISPVSFWLILIGLWLYLFIMPFIIYSFSITTGMGRSLSRFGIGGPVLVYLIVYFLGQIGMILGYFFIPISLRLTNLGQGASWSIVQAFPYTSLFKLGEIGNEVDFDDIIHRVGGTFDFGLGMIVVVVAFLIFAYLWTKRQMAQVDLR